MARSFLGKATRSCLRRPLQVNLYHLVLRKYLLFALNLIKQCICPLDSQNPGNTVGMIQDVPEKAISEVRASTSSGSVLPQEKLKLAFNLMRVSNQTLRILEYRLSSLPILLFFAGSIGQGGGQAQDDTKLNALKERVKTLSSEKAALQGKLKQLSQAKKG